MASFWGGMEQEEAHKKSRMEKMFLTVIGPGWVKR